MKKEKFDELIAKLPDNKAAVVDEASVETTEAELKQLCEEEDIEYIE